MDNSIVVADFISQIWNNRAFEKLDKFLHPDFKDHSLPNFFPPGAVGTKQWIVHTGISFEHQTVIEDQVTEGHTTIIRITMNLKHIGTWRNIEPTGTDLQVTGYRHFKIKGGKIIEHCALIDGQAIENQLKSAFQGCQTAQ